MNSQIYNLVEPYFGYLLKTLNPIVKYKNMVKKETEETILALTVHAKN